MEKLNGHQERWPFAAQLNGRWPRPGFTCILHRHYSKGCSALISKQIPLELFIVIVHTFYEIRNAGTFHPGFADTIRVDSFGSRDHGRAAGFPTGPPGGAVV